MESQNYIKSIVTPLSVISKMHANGVAADGANRCPDEKCQERELQGENEKRNCLVVASFSSAAEGRHKDEFEIVGH